MEGIETSTVRAPSPRGAHGAHAARQAAGCRGWRPPALDAEDGAGLVEILVAIVVLTVALVSMAGLATASLTSLAASRQRQLATAAASQSLELARTYPFSDLAMLTTDPVTVAVGASYDPDGAGPIPSEAVVAASTGRVTGATHQAGSGSISVRTYVTSVAAGTRRVTAVATFPTTGGTGQLRESTVVAAAQEGWSIVPFTLTPRVLQQSTTFNGRAACFGHTVTNQSVEDRYSVVLPTVANFTVHAYVDTNGNGVGDSAEILTDLAGDANPDTATVPTNGSLPLLVCYAPTTDADADFTASVSVRSHVQPAVVATASHRLVVDGTVVLHLHDPDNTRNHARDTAANFAMDTTATGQTTLYDYDTNLDSRLLPGTFLPRSDAGLRWDRPFTEPTQVQGPWRLRIWSSWNDALALNVNLATLLGWRVTVQRLDAAGNVLQTLGDETFTYTHALGGWQEVVVDPTATTTPFAAGEILRLRLSCASSLLLLTDCHVAYDATTMPSTFTVEMR